jgi:hypothetical protein
MTKRTYSVHECLSSLCTLGVDESRVEVALAHAAEVHVPVVTASAIKSTLIFLGGGLTTAPFATTFLEFFLFSLSMGWSPKSIDRPTQVGLPTAATIGNDDGRGGDTMGMVILGVWVELIVGMELLPVC